MLSVAALSVTNQYFSVTNLKLFTLKLRCGSVVCKYKLIFIKFSPFENP